LGHESKRLARVDFGLFLKHFFQMFLPIFFCFSIYRVISISCPRSCVWFVHRSWLSASLEAFFNLFFMFISYQQVSISYIFLMCSAFRNIFLWCEFIQSFSLYYHLSMVNLSFIYLNKNFNKHNRINISSLKFLSWLLLIIFIYLHEWLSIYLVRWLHKLFKWHF
jgi:hypothetical protein